jgi:hypothetical protein
MPVGRLPRAPAPPARSPDLKSAGGAVDDVGYPVPPDPEVRMARIRGRTAALPVVVAVLLLAAPAAAQEGGTGEQSGGLAGGGREELPAPLGGIFDALNPARAHRRFDRWLGLDTEQSDKPRAPEIPLSVFVETVRPLGALKYENQFNYFVGAFTGSAPTLQTMTYEYVFADWHAARVEVIAPRPGQIDALGFGYQRTLGVGRDHNRAHGVLILPEVSIKGTGFVGGSTFYTLAWKPEEESPWTFGGSAGANRASFATRPLGGAEGGTGSMMARMPGEAGRMATRPEREEEVRVWRSFAALNAWYTFSPRLTVGLEADAYPHSRFGEYLVQPNLTWRPTEHFFVQFGAGWYEIGGRSQASFMCRVNILNPSGRRSREGD